MAKSDRILAALCYVLWPVALLLLLLQDEKHRYHAVNGLGFAVAVFIICILLTVIPFIGWMLTPVYWLAVLIVAILYARDAYHGKKIVIPVVTDFLKKNIKGFK